jgi:hypothetical protein
MKKKKKNKKQYQKEKKGKLYQQEMATRYSVSSAIQDTLWFVRRLIIVPPAVEIIIPARIWYKGDKNLDWEICLIKN